MALEAEPEAEKPKKKTLGLWELFYLFDHLFASVNLKILFFSEAISDS